MINNMFKKNRSSTVGISENSAPYEPLIEDNLSNQHFQSEHEFQNNTNFKEEKVQEIMTDQTPTLQNYERPTIVEEDDDSEEDERSYQETIQRKNKQKAEVMKLAQKKMAIGGGFSLDMGDFFKFKSKKKTEGKGLSEFVTGGHLAWLILFYYVCNSAIMPGWIMNIKANKILRISWRFLFQAIFMIPFVLYEKRSGDEHVKRKYEWSYIFNLEGIRKVYLSSLGTSIWFTIILTCFEWTYISHSLMMGSLTNFFLSLSRSAHSSAHSLEPGGQIFVIIGILFTISDSYMLNPERVLSETWEVINPYFLTREPYQRVIADLAALSGSFILSIFSQKTADLKTHYPPFLSILMVNVFVAIQVGFSAYLINGATFDRDTNFGVLGIFTDANFGSFFYMVVILSFGTLVSFLLIAKLFANPIIPALAMTLEPFFATFFLNLVGVQKMPGSFSIYGYIFLICGLFLILIGQFVLQREKEEKEEQENMEKEIKEKILEKFESLTSSKHIELKEYERGKSHKPEKDTREHPQSDIIHG